MDTGIFLEKEGQPTAYKTVAAAESNSALVEEVWEKIWKEIVSVSDIWALRLQMMMRMMVVVVVSGAPPTVVNYWTLEVQTQE